MKYSRKQLIKGMEEYYRDALVSPDDFGENEGTLQNAVDSIDYLIEIIKKQENE